MSILENFKINFIIDYIFFLFISLRKECEKKKKEFFADCDDQRFMFLPVDWRSSLILDDGIVESITIKTIQFIRDRLNSSALDIMYYTSALFKTEVK